MSAWSRHGRSVCRFSSGIRSVQPAGISAERDGTARRGRAALPSTLISTTGRPCAAKGLDQSRRNCVITPSIGCAVGRPTMPFCRSITSKAGFGVERADRHVVAAPLLESVRRTCARLCQVSTRRLRRRSENASCACSSADSLLWMARSSQSCRAARPVRINSRQAGVNDRMVCRPSFVSGDPLTSPAPRAPRPWRPSIASGRPPSAPAR